MEHRDLIAHIDTVNPTIRHSKEFFSWAFSVWRDFGQTGQPLTAFTSALKVADEALRISLQDYTGVPHNFNVSPSQKLVDLYNVKSELDRVVEAITFSTLFHQEYKLGKWKVDAYGNLHLV